MIDRVLGKKTYFLIIALILIVVLLMISLLHHSNEKDVESIKVTPNTFFCPLGEKLEAPIIINFDGGVKTFSQDYNLGKTIFDSLVSLNSTLDLANKMYEILTVIQPKGDVNKLDQIRVPPNACYINSKEIVPTYNDQNLLSGLEFDLLYADIQLYSWNTEYKLNSGKSGNDIELVMILNEHLVYGKIEKLGNTKMKVTIWYGTKK